VGGNFLGRKYEINETEKMFMVLLQNINKILKPALVPVL
jgi:hypothetical protein